MLEEILKNENNYDFVIEFKAKQEIKEFTTQDKNHLRIMAIINIAKNNDEVINRMINHAFTEHFKFDQKNNTAYYCVKFIKERKVKKKYADC